MHPSHRKGAVSEYLAAAHYSALGWEIFWPPTGSSPSDFVMVRGEDTQRVQVKTAGYWTKSGSKYIRVRLGGNKAYQSGDFDILVVVDATTDRIWAIPFDKLPKTSMLYLEKEGGASERDYGWDEYEVTNGP